MTNSVLPFMFKAVSFTGAFPDPVTVHVAETIVIIQKSMNFQKWTPFSVSDYMERCNHIMDGIEKVAIEKMASVGLLTVHEGNKYVVTPRFLEVVGKYADLNSGPDEIKKKKK